MHRNKFDYGIGKATNYDKFNHVIDLVYYTTQDPNPVRLTQTNLHLKSA